MPDVSYISSFKGITTVDIANSSATLNTAVYGFYDVVTGEAMSNGPVSSYRLEVIFRHLFQDTAFLSTGSILYDWTMVPTYRVTITNPNPLPNYDPNFPYCVEAVDASFCTTQSIGGNPVDKSAVLFYAYNSGWTYGTVIPTSLTCADLGYSSSSSIIDAGVPAGNGLIGTCRFRPNY